tara:strand:+ start:4386 stop:4601 length:216 start_codon:yes stop_codon:yes gene_type:complete
MDNEYNNLSINELVDIIKTKDKEIRILKESENKYFLQNKFHIEEITRLDKIIGGYKKDKNILKLDNNNIKK